MSKFGLGRGLGDLKNEMGLAPEISILAGNSDRVVVKHIPLIQIGVNKDQPRKTFNEQELQDLSASIKEQGVLQPIILRSVRGRDYMYEIVAGERRYRASKMAGLSEIPALVKDLSDNNAMEIALIENVQRENLNPIEEAAGYVGLINKCGYELADVARLIGKSESYIKNSLRLNDLPDSVKDMVKNGDLSASHARTILVADNPEALAKNIVEKKLSVAETGVLVKNVKRSGTSRKVVNNNLSPDYVNKIKKDIERKFGLKVKVLERKGGAGQIILSYENRNQLDEFIEKIK